MSENSFRLFSTGINHEVDISGTPVKVAFQKPEIPITINKYVISLIGIGSVRYLMIPNIAKSPSAKPNCNFTFSRRKQSKKTVILIIKYVNK